MQSEQPEQLGFDVPQGEEPLRYVGEVFRTYILAERGDELCLIDKHAAHERQLYEKLAANYGNVPSQLLLQPAAIDLRVDKMLEAGLLAEAEYVWHNREAFRTAAQAIGYKDFFPYFQQTATLEVCTEKLKQASRNYAKRQLTWFRHMDGVTWLDAGAADVRQTALRLTQDFLLKG